MHIATAEPTIACEAPPELAQAILAEALEELAVRRPWTDVEAELTAARAAFCAGCSCIDAIALGREPNEDEEALYEELSARDEAAFGAALAFEPRSLAEAAAKSAALKASEHAELSEDLILTALARDIATLAKPSPLAAVPWTDALCELGVAERAWLAADNNDVEQDRLWGDAHGKAETLLMELPAPSLRPLVQKMAVRLLVNSNRGESTDDTLVRLLGSGEYEDWTLAAVMIDTVTLARLAGEDVPLYPRALIARLGQIGVEVTPRGFNFPDGLRQEALALLNTLQPDHVDTLRAAAWIDAYVAVGGTITMFDTGAGKRLPYFSADLTPDHDAEQDRLLDMLPTREGVIVEAANARLRLSVAKLAAEQAHQREAQAFSAILDYPEVAA